MTNKKTYSGEIHKLSIAAVKVEYSTPRAFRIGRMPDGSIVLQGAYLWTQGDLGGIDWRTIPVVNLDESGKEIPDQQSDQKNALHVVDFNHLVGTKNFI